MKGPKVILFRLLFLTAVIFCLVLEEDIHYSFPTGNTEFSYEQNDDDDFLLYHFDLFEDDHVRGDCEFFSLVERLVVIPFSNESFLLEKFSFSGWQPPKYS